MFTLAGYRMIISANARQVDIGSDLLEKIQFEGWRWSAHVHPGTKDVVLTASRGGRHVLQMLNQSQSLILTSTGTRSVFTLEKNTRILRKGEYNNRIGLEQN